MNRPRPFIKTFIYLDFETTGLFGRTNSDVQKFKKSKTSECETERFRRLIVNTPIDCAPHITELSIVIVTRDQLQSAISRLENDTENDEQTITKLIEYHAHTQLIKPVLDEFEWLTYGLKQLKIDAIKYTKSDLNNKRSFAEEWPIVYEKLKNVEKPACIIAHNGLAFDFRLLQIELKRHRLLQRIPDDIYFIDSYLMITALEKKYLCDFKQKVDGQDWNNAITNDSYAREILSAASSLQCCRRSAKNLRIIIKKNLYINMLNNNSWQFNDQIMKDHFKGGQRKLEKLYADLVGTPYRAHHAEDDCVALMRVTIAYGQDFIGYVDRNSYQLPFE